MQFGRIDAFHIRPHNSLLHFIQSFCYSSSRRSRKTVRSTAASLTVFCLLSFVIGLSACGTDVESGVCKSGIQLNNRITLTPMTHYSSGEKITLVLQDSLIIWPIKSGGFIMLISQLIFPKAIVAYAQLQMG